MASVVENFYTIIWAVNLISTKYGYPLEMPLLLACIALAVFFNILVAMEMLKKSSISKKYR